MPHEVELRYCNVGHFGWTCCGRADAAVATQDNPLNGYIAGITGQASGGLNGAMRKFALDAQKAASASKAALLQGSDTTTHPDGDTDATTRGGIEGGPPNSRTLSLADGSSVLGCAMALRYLPVKSTLVVTPLAPIDLTAMSKKREEVYRGLHYNPQYCQIGGGRGLGGSGVDGSAPSPIHRVQSGKFQQRFGTVGFASDSDGGSTAAPESGNDDDDGVYLYGEDGELLMMDDGDVSGGDIEEDAERALFEAELRNQAVNRIRRRLYEAGLDEAIEGVRAKKKSQKQQTRTTAENDASTTTGAAAASTSEAPFASSSTTTSPQPGGVVLLSPIGSHDDDGVSNNNNNTPPSFNIVKTRMVGFNDALTSLRKKEEKEEAAHAAQLSCLRKVHSVQLTAPVGDNNQGGFSTIDSPPSSLSPPPGLVARHANSQGINNSPRAANVTDGAQTPAPPLPSSYLSARIESTEGGLSVSHRGVVAVTKALSSSTLLSPSSPLRRSQSSMNSSGKEDATRLLTNGGSDDDCNNETVINGSIPVNISPAAATVTLFGAIGFKPLSLQESILMDRYEADAASRAASRQSQLNSPSSATSNNNAGNSNRSGVAPPVGGVTVIPNNMNDAESQLWGRALDNYTKRCQTRRAVEQSIHASKYTCRYYDYYRPMRAAVFAFEFRIDACPFDRNSRWWSDEASGYVLKKNKKSSSDTTTTTTTTQADLDLDTTVNNASTVNDTCPTFITRRLRNGPRPAADIQDGSEFLERGSDDHTLHTSPGGASSHHHNNTTNNTNTNTSSSVNQSRPQPKHQSSGERLVIGLCLRDVMPPSNGANPYITKYGDGAASCSSSDGGDDKAFTLPPTVPELLTKHRLTIGSSGGGSHSAPEVLPGGGKRAAVDASRGGGGGLVGADDAGEGILAAASGIGWWAYSTHIRGLGGAINVEARQPFGEGDTVTIVLDGPNNHLHFFKNRLPVASVRLPAPTSGSSWTASSGTTTSQTKANTNSNTNTGGAPNVKLPSRDAISGLVASDFENDEEGQDDCDPNASIFGSEASTPFGTGGGGSGGASHNSISPKTNIIPPLNPTVLAADARLGVLRRHQEVLTAASALTTSTANTSADGAAAIHQRRGALSNSYTPFDVSPTTTSPPQQQQQQLLSRRDSIESGGAGATHNTRHRAGKRSVLVRSSSFAASSYVSGVSSGGGASPGPTSGFHSLLSLVLGGIDDNNAGDGSGNSILMPPSGGAAVKKPIPLISTNCDNVSTLEAGCSSLLSSITKPLPPQKSVTKWERIARQAAVATAAGAATGNKKNSMSGASSPPPPRGGRSPSPTRGGSDRRGGAASVSDVSTLLQPADVTASTPPEFITSRAVPDELVELYAEYEAAKTLLDRARQAVIAEAAAASAAGSGAMQDIAPPTSIMTSSSTPTTVSAGGGILSPASTKTPKMNTPTSRAKTDTTPTKAATSSYFPTVIVSATSTSTFTPSGVYCYDHSGEGGLYAQSVVPLDEVMAAQGVVATYDAAVSRHALHTATISPFVRAVLLNRLLGVEKPTPPSSKAVDTTTTSSRKVHEQTPPTMPMLPPGRGGIMRTTSAMKRDDVGMEAVGGGQHPPAHLPQWSVPLATTRPPNSSITLATFNPTANDDSLDAKQQDLNPHRIGGNSNNCNSITSGLSSLAMSLFIPSAIDGLYNGYWSERFATKGKTSSALSAPTASASSPARNPGGKTVQGGGPKTTTTTATPSTKRRLNATTHHGGDGSREGAADSSGIEPMPVYLTSAAGSTDLEDEQRRRKAIMSNAFVHLIPSYLSSSGLLLDCIAELSSDIPPFDILSSSADATTTTTPMLDASIQGGGGGGGPTRASSSSPLSATLSPGPSTFTTNTTSSPSNHIVNITTSPMTSSYHTMPSLLGGAGEKQHHQQSSSSSSNISSTSLVLSTLCRGDAVPLQRIYDTLTYTESTLYNHTSILSALQAVVGRIHTGTPLSKEALEEAVKEEILARCGVLPQRNTTSTGKPNSIHHQQDAPPTPSTTNILQTTAGGGMVVSRPRTPAAAGRTSSRGAMHHQNATAALALRPGSPQAANSLAPPSYNNGVHIITSPVSLDLKYMLTVLSLFGAGSTATQIESRRLAREARMSMRRSLKAHFAHIQGWKSTAVGNTIQSTGGGGGGGRVASSKRNTAVGLASSRRSTSITKQRSSVAMSSSTLSPNIHRRRRSTTHTAGPTAGGGTASWGPHHGILPPVPTDLPPTVDPPPPSSGIATNTVLPTSSGGGMASSSVWIPCVSLPPSCKVSVESLFNRHSVGYVDGYFRSRAEVDEGLLMCAAPVSIPPPVGVVRRE